MQLHFKSFGQGDPVVILHGLFGMLDNWQTVAKKLAENYTVFIVDQRNHGKSPHAPEFNYTILAEDLREFMESNWIYKSHIIGHSMGGKTAMQFAFDHPDMIDRLVVVDIGPQRNPESHQAIFEALLSLPVGELQARKEAEEHLAARLSDPGIRQFLLKNLKRQKEGGYRWKMNLPVLHERYEEILSAVSGAEAFAGPSLFLRGERSDYLRSGQLPAIRELFPTAKLLTIPAAGHWVHVDQPEELLKQISEFFSFEF